MDTVPRKVTFDVLSAYRSELARRGEGRALGEDDAAWITVGKLLERAAQFPLNERADLLKAARETVRNVLSSHLWASGPYLDPQPPSDDEALAPRVRALCEQIEDAGAPLLADALLSSFTLAEVELSPIERGRCTALRARLAWKRGDNVLAESYYEAVARQGRAARSAELVARADIGFAVVARLRGNLPASRDAGTRAVKTTERYGFRQLASLAHQTLMFVAVAGANVDEAVKHAWASFLNAEGDEVAEGAVLVDIAQLFYDNSHIDVAAAAYAAALSRPLPARLRFPALGGASLVAARKGERVTVARIVQELEGAASSVVLPYATASACLDAAEACRLVTDEATAERLRTAAERLAKTYAYHELAHRTEQLATLPAMRQLDAPTTLSRESAVIGEAVCKLAAALT